MIKWRCFLPLLLCSSALFGQGRPDFSGVFFRTDAFLGKPKQKHKSLAEPLPPLTLLVRQTSEKLEVTAIQNWATNTSHYALNGAESRNTDRDGYQTQDRSHFENQSLLIETQALDGLRQKQSWELSPDQQTLTLTRQIHSGNYSGTFTETYARQPSLEAAMERAEAISEMNKCNAIPPPRPIRRPRKYDEGAPLGFTGFQQFRRHVAFYAGFSGLFFHKLVRVEKHGVSQFRRKGGSVETFPDSVDLEIWPGASIASLPEFDALPRLIPLPEVPTELWDLRFRLRWSGVDTRDLGEVKSVLLDVWSATMSPRQWYLVRVPAKNVPLTDSLEIQIVTSTGQQLGCISGHI